MQTKLMQKKRERKDYPQVNFIKEGVQYIEINRGCKRQCPFCYADPNYKVFEVPEIKSNKVQIWGEGILFDQKVKEKIIELGSKKVNNKVVYYSLGQGIDFRLLTEKIAELLSKNRFGIINNKKNWYKGIKFAWDRKLDQEKGILKTIELFEKVGYKRKAMQIFVLVNWKIDYETCLYKLEKLKEWGVKIDDCTWDTTKRQKLPFYWTKEQLVDFRKKARKHNQLINFDGYDPEQNKKLRFNKK